MTTKKSNRIIKLACDLSALLLALLSGCAGGTCSFLEDIQAEGCKVVVVECRNRQTFAVCDGRDIQFPVKCEVGPDGYVMPHYEDCEP